MCLLLYQDNIVNVDFIDKNVVVKIQLHNALSHVNSMKFVLEKKILLEIKFKVTKTTIIKTALLVIYDFVAQQNYLKLDVVTFFKVAFNNCFSLKKPLKKSLKIHKTKKAK